METPPPHQAGVLRESLKVSQEVTGLTATGIQEEEIERKIVNTELGKLGEKKGRLHPKETAKAMKTRQMKLEAATLQQDHPSTLHHNLNC